MILVDLNVVLDVIQAREPHYQASAWVIDRVVSRNEEGALAAHAVTTIHYLVGRYRDQKTDRRLRHIYNMAIPCTPEALE